jgi:L-threonylcarbamoyladenylate synthase
VTAPILPATTETIGRAADILRAGGLVVMPTETVYGLAGDATNATAVARIFEAKGRPRFNPLISHVRGLDDAETLADLPEQARRLAAAFWPGPLTLVAPRRPSAPVSDLACAGLATIALRAPAHDAAQALISALGRPVAAPSANKSGRLSPTRAEHAAEDVGDAAAFIIDGGPCAHGLESTVIGFPPSEDAVLLRPGAIARASIEAVVGIVRAAGGGAPSSPGMLESHYAPRAALRLNALAAQGGEAYLAFGAAGPAGALNLSPSGDLVEAAANLFSHLRKLDASGAERIAVAPIPETGLGEAINDRLSRAEAPR